MSHAILQLTQSLRQQNSPIQLEEVGYLELSYRPARIQQHGTLIQPPRHVWVLQAGKPLSPPQATIALDKDLKVLLEQGLSKAVSFELPGLGMCYRQDGQFELLPGKVKSLMVKADYGLMAVNVKKTTAANADKRTQSMGSLLPKRSGLWWLQVAAVLLLVLFVNVLVISSLSEDGKLNIRQVAELNPFDSLTDREDFTFDDSTDDLTLPAGSSKDPLKVVKNDTLAQVDSQLPVEVAEKKAEEKPAVQVTPSEKVKPMVQPLSKDVPVVSSDAQGAAATLVVVGAFASVENAEKLKNSLADKGWASRIERGENGQLNRVMVVSPADNVDPEAFLLKVKNKINPQSWILAK